MPAARDEDWVQWFAHVREDLHVERLGIIRDMEDGVDNARRSAADAWMLIADSRVRLAMSRSLLSKPA